MKQKAISKEEGTLVCSGCRQSLPASPEYFFRDAAQPRGFSYYCKVCRRNNERGNPKFLAKWIKRRTVAPHKISARQAARTAVTSGKLVRPKYCTSCLNECTPQGHHPDYSKPLEVMWLCRSCHAQQHNNYSNPLT